MPRKSSVLYYTLYVTIGFIYPAYCSLLALDTPDKKDDTTWLIYWIVFSLYNILEFPADFLLSWFPLYPLMKLCFLLWCTAPIGKNGAFFLYKIFIEPFYKMYGGHLNYGINQALYAAKSAADYIPAYPK